MIWLSVGVLSLGIGAITALIPMLPSFPFLLLAGISFARSSERMNQWFLQSSLYKNNLESYLKGLGMTKAAKYRVMTTLTIGMAFGFVMMIRKELYIPCTILGIIWIAHIIYFVFGVKTCGEEAIPVTE